MKGFCSVVALLLGSASATNTSITEAVQLREDSILATNFTSELSTESHEEPVYPEATSHAALIGGASAGAVTAVGAVGWFVYTRQSGTSDEGAEPRIQEVDEDMLELDHRFFE
eukprot:Blabericola_migrator_1__13237@NODE_91_length_14555_cov_140_209277_g81_i0_p18_GENE_NODE_91_length_14555_cov_140_209277_g81_i0NODE_91_length_14555_cov_140_209277_g81_i0_p18_ORF_typecomplete_len113_score8_93Syndecan/PF01034_20/0_17Alpha_GJ/PF03229_13/0_33_NODE_91_length_14555_cov_140_209277_g81_i0292630